jgi:hypothetical protein
MVPEITVQRDTDFYDYRLFVSIVWFLLPNLILHKVRVVTAGQQLLLAVDKVRCI